MNYLAHLALSAPDPALMAGGFVADFIKGPTPTDWDAGMVRGIELHRAIDAFSDGHPELAKLRSALPQKWRRYAGILLDMLTDHCLASHWYLFNNQALEDFIDHCHRALQSYRSQMPVDARFAADRLCNNQWLRRYADLDFTLGAITHLGRRMRFDNPLYRTTELFPDYYANFYKHGCALYGDALRYVAEWRTDSVATPYNHAEYSTD